MAFEATKETQASMGADKTRLVSARILVIIGRKRWGGYAAPDGLMTAALPAGTCTT
jgi:hypothetical protein